MRISAGSSDVSSADLRGFREGRMGRKYHGVCPPQAVSGFLAGYDDGPRVHAAEEHRDEIRRDVRRFEQRMNDIADELDEIADQIGDSGLERGERDYLRSEEHPSELSH